MNSSIIKVVCIVLVFFSVLGCKKSETVNKKQTVEAEICHNNSDQSNETSIESGQFTAQKAQIPVVIDGCGKDEVWSNATWYGMNYLWMGEPVSPADYQGRFKLCWDTSYLYILVEVTDDVLNPTLKDGIENYWKGDYVEVFIDEDQSGGDHKSNHQAFAYHVSTEGHAIDINTQETPVFFDDHVKVERVQEGDRFYWEMAIKLHDGDFDESKISDQSIALQAQKTIGFSIAYGDNDGNKTRENFMGSKKTHGVNNDEGYVNSSVFGSVLLID